MDLCESPNLFPSLQPSASNIILTGRKEKRREREKRESATQTAWTTGAQLSSVYVCERQREEEERVRRKEKIRQTREETKKETVCDFVQWRLRETEREDVAPTLREAWRNNDDATNGDDDENE